MELPTSISSIVRRILVESGNKPVRVNALWDTVRALPDVQCTKTFFKRKIIGNMFVREEVRGVVLSAALFSFTLLAMWVCFVVL
jgi:hypothetical protein